MADSNTGPDPVRVELEAKLTFLERTVEVMSKVMHEQSSEIEQLEQRLSKLENTAAEADEDGAGGGLRPHDDPPPHY